MPVRMIHFLPRLSDIRPMMGMKTDRERAKAEKMTPSQMPVAPRFSA
ncbi:MAG: hypothetical protein BWX50_01522 [Euryarchaeota archaeon ADurb.Bin009]|nr:MAG: hypothetical protein BWX50_01522 [Euryarchaeota archaeon ADurb.Bin009]